MSKVKDRFQSFTKYEKTCEFHVVTVQRICYCAKTDETCNKLSCPKFETVLKEGQ